MLRKCSPNGLFNRPKSSFGEHNIVERKRLIAHSDRNIGYFFGNVSIQTKDCERPNKHFRVPFRQTFQRFVAKYGALTLEKDFEHPHVFSCSSFQNLRLAWAYKTQPTCEMWRRHCPHMSSRICIHILPNTFRPKTMMRPSCTTPFPSHILDASFASLHRRAGCISILPLVFIKSSRTIA